MLAQEVNAWENKAADIHTHTKVRNLLWLSIVFTNEQAITLIKGQDVVYGVKGLT